MDFDREFLIVWSYHDLHVSYYDSFTEAVKMYNYLKNIHENDCDFQISLYEAIKRAWLRGD